MKPSLLCCPVCGKPLTFLEKTAQCPSGHTYDRAARGGYIHLLRQHRRGSADPGDSAAMCQVAGMSHCAVRLPRWYTT